MKKILKITILMIAFLLFITNYNYAVVEIKDTTSVLTNKTISQYYDMAEEMTSAGQGLEGATVGVKMANNYEWAVVSYFSNSNYGTGGTGGNDGTDISEGLTTTHKSTNGNITGVMDWGKHYTYTAGIISSYQTAVQSSTISTSGGQSIINAAGTEKVDKVAPGTSYDIAKTGWYNASSTVYGEAAYPYSFRKGLFSVFMGTYYTTGCYYAADGGNRNNNVTFRPVFYAK